MSSFDRLPNEILFHIFSFLPYKNLEDVALVCSAWRYASKVRKEKILKVVGNVLKYGYNELVNKKHESGLYDSERRPWKKVEKIVIKNLKSGVCQILKEDGNDRMYYRIPPALIQKLLFTTNVESVKSLHKLPENKQWIQQHKWHKKFSFPDKTFVEVFSSYLDLSNDGISMIDISDFENYLWSDFLKGVVSFNGSHTLGKETKYQTLHATNGCFNCLWVGARVVGCFLGSTLLGQLAARSSIVACGTLTINAIETKKDLDRSGYFYVNITGNENQRRLLDRTTTKMGEVYVYFEKQIKKVMKVYTGSKRLSLEESDKIQKMLVDCNSCLKMYIQSISTVKPEVIKAFQTLFPQAWEGS